jgi:His/Glu/Gln/Arg/opine family amino acid ABC transporter permease subunit
MEIIKQVADAIYSNLIREDRYMLLVKGLLTTLEITMFALLIGLLIGLLTAITRIFKIRGLEQAASLYVHVIRGTPVVVQLIIIYYAVFGSVDLNKVLVASAAFGINSGAYVSELIRAGVGAVDRGQMEAARSLGLSAGRSMRYVVLPQAVKNILPALVNEAVSLLKETAVAGYIALDDLTRSGNIIRSRTYDAYTPFLLVAVVYLYSTTVLSILARKLERRLGRSD